MKLNMPSLKRLSVALAIFCAGLPASSTAQNGEIDWQRMDRDLEIMQGVLDKMLSPYSGGPGLLSSRAHGIYLEGYGVLFQADITPDLFAGLRIDSEDLDVYVRDNQTVVRVTPGGRVDALATAADPDNKQDVSEEVKKQVEDFFTTYAGAIGQLREQDKVSVLINFGDALRSLRIGAPGGAAEDRSGPLRMTVLKKDIEALRRQKLSDSEFRARIQAPDDDGEPGGKQELEIMANILQTALSKRRGPALGTIGSQGAYLPGLGAVFFLSGDGFPGVDLVDLPKKLEAYFGEDALREHRKTAKEGEAAEYKSFKETLLSLAASYGHTLSALAPDEQLIIAVDFGRIISFGRQDQPRRLVFQAKKKDLDAYSRSEISLDAFRQRVQFKEL